MAHASAGSDSYRHGWLRVGSRDGEAIEEIRLGDVVWFAPGEKHWHGATPTTAMTHTAVQEQLDGKVVEWMQKATEEQYRRRQLLMFTDWSLQGFLTFYARSLA